MTLAIDASNYSTPLTPEALAAWKADSVGLVIVQSLQPPVGYPVGETVDQVQACLDAGLAVDAYVWLWFDLDVSDIQHKLSLLAPFAGRIRQLWLDVEDTAAQKYDQATTEAKVSAALAACDAFSTTSGEKTGVYTGRWFWTDRRYLANSASFADRELWDAAYDGQQTTDGFAPYGGWSTRAIHQYQGTSTLAGIGNVDLDVLSVAEAGELVTVVTPTPVTARETPDDYPFPSWRESAIAYRGALDGVVPQLQDAEARIHTAMTALQEAPRAA